MGKIDRPSQKFQAEDEERSRVRRRFDLKVGSVNGLMVDRVGKLSIEQLDALVMPC